MAIIPFVLAFDRNPFGNIRVDCWFLQKVMGVICVKCYEVFRLPAESGRALGPETVDPYAPNAKPLELAPLLGESFDSRFDDGTIWGAAKVPDTSLWVLRSWADIPPHSELVWTWVEGAGIVPAMLQWLQEWVRETQPAAWGIARTEIGSRFAICGWQGEGRATDCWPPPA